MKRVLFKNYSLFILMHKFKKGKQGTVKLPLKSIDANHASGEIDNFVFPTR